jgi:hypothetical protein
MRVRHRTCGCGERLALRRPRLSALRRGFRRRANADDSVKAALHEIRRTRALPAPLTAPKPSTWHAGLVKCRRGRCPDRRERLARPPAGTALAPLFRSHPESALRRASFRLSASIRDNCQVLSLLGRQCVILRAFWLRHSSRPGANTAPFRARSPEIGGAGSSIHWKAITGLYSAASL